MAHIPVLLHEVIEGVNVGSGMTALDATVGAGGYTRALCEKVGSSGIVIGIDRDERTLAETRERLSAVPCALHLVEENFRNLDTVLDRLNIPAVHAITFDLGLSSLQLEESGRGFSFLRDEPLSMTFSSKKGVQPFTAYDIVNSWDEEDIANVIFGYGEERYARRIAKGIVEARQKSPITSTTELVAVVKSVVPGRYKNGPLHPATRTFQALRIAVNDELGALREGLSKAFARLVPGGRIAAVSFHSLEDRIVKQFFKEREDAGEAVRVTKKPITPGLEEERMNPRARSAKLRVIQKTS